VDDEKGHEISHPATYLRCAFRSYHGACKGTITLFTSGFFLFPMVLQRKQIENTAILFLALIVVLVSLVIPAPDGLEREGVIMLGVMLMAAVLWIGEPLPMPVTGLIVLIAPPLLIAKLGAPEVFAAFGNEAVFFLIGAFMLAAAVEKHNLHKRIALRFLVRFESSPRTFVLGIMLAGALLSFIMPEHAVVALLLPITLSILMETGAFPGKSNFGKSVMIAVAFGCSIGSLATPIGGARNPYTIGFLSDNDIEVSFLDWMIYSLPVVIIAIPVVWIIIVRLFPPEINDLISTKKMLENEIRSLGSPDEKARLTVYVYALTIVLWIFLHEQLNLAVIAVLGALFMFIVGSVNWKDVETRVPWGIILLYGGAITMGKYLYDYGASAWLAGTTLDVVGRNPYVILFMLIVITIMLTNLMSNTAAVAMLLPIGLAFSREVDELSDIVCSMTIALSGGLAFMLVIATPGNLITYSSGHFSSRELLRVGLPATLAAIAVMFTVIVTYWKLLSLW